MMIYAQHNGLHLAQVVARLDAVSEATPPNEVLVEFWPQATEIAFIR